MRKLICICWFAGALSLAAVGQDLPFSQFYEKPLLRNPALAGVFDGDIRVSAVFRNQWPTVSVPFRTGAMSLEYKLPIKQWDDWVTIGLQASHDVAGDIKLKRTQILPVVNFHKSLSGNVDDYLSLALMMGPVNSQFDPTTLKMDDQFVDGSYNPNNPTNQIFQRTGFSYMDASIGLTFSSGFAENARYYIGSALFHFNKPRVAFYTDNSNVHLNNKWVVNGGASIPTSDINTLTFFADYFSQGGHTQFQAGAVYQTELARAYDSDKRMALSAGASLRWNDAVIPVVKLDMYDLSIGLSYDVNISKLRSASQWRGGLELTAVWKAKLTNRSYYLDKVLCPH